MRLSNVALTGLLAATLAGCTLFRPGPANPPPSTPPPEQVVTSTAPLTVDAPQPGAVVSSPLTVRGLAPGPWYFEASFPLRVEDANGLLLGQGIAQATEPWMTTDDVPFVGTVSFSRPVTDTGRLVLVKDNPSGLPENDAAVSIPIRFTPLPATGTGPCIVTGCSSHVCAPEPVMTTCEYAPSYACYRTARCERQADGQCGWTMTPELQRCLSQP